MSAMFASRFPEKVKSLVLAGAPIDTDAGRGPIKKLARTLPLATYQEMVKVGDGRMLGKPSDPGDARSMLRALSGRWHDVLTGVVLLRGDGWVGERVSHTEVRLADLTDEEIERYMAERACPVCKGRRLKPEALAVTVADKPIDEVTAMSVVVMLDWIQTWSRR